MTTHPPKTDDKPAHHASRKAHPSRAATHKQQDVEQTPGDEQPTTAADAQQPEQAANQPAASKAQPLDLVDLEKALKQLPPSQNASTANYRSALVTCGDAVLKIAERLNQLEIPKTAQARTAAVRYDDAREIEETVELVLGEKDFARVRGAVKLLGPGAAEFLAATRPDSLKGKAKDPALALVNGMSKQMLLTWQRGLMFGKDGSDKTDDAQPSAGTSPQSSSTLPDALPM